MLGEVYLKDTSEGVIVRGQDFRLPSRVFLNNTNIQTSTHNPFRLRKLILYMVN